MNFWPAVATQALTSSNFWLCLMSFKHKHKTGNSWQYHKNIFRFNLLRVWWWMVLFLSFWFLYYQPKPQFKWSKNILKNLNLKLYFMHICQYTKYEWEHIRQHVQGCLLKLSIKGSLVLTTYMIDVEKKITKNIIDWLNFEVFTMLSFAGWDHFSF